MTYPGYPFEAMIKELQRELEMRKTVYPKWLRNKQLTTAQALERIEMMEHVLHLVTQARDEAQAAQLGREGKL